MSPEKPSVGIACLLHQQGKLLLFRRPKQPQLNSWQCPGGFLKFNETTQEAGQRILQHNLGFSLPLSNTAFHTNNFFKNHNQHSLTIYLSAYLDPEIYNIQNAQWFNFDNMPNNLFLPLSLLIKNYRNELKNLI